MPDELLGTHPAGDFRGFGLGSHQSRLKSIDPIVNGWWLCGSLVARLIAIAVNLS
jgi:hypothetical protein